MTRGDSWEDASCCLACLRSADTKLTRQRDMHKRTRLLRKRSKSWISDHPVSKTNADKVQKKKKKNLKGACRLQGRLLCGSDLG